MNTKTASQIHATIVLMTKTAIAALVLVGSGLAFAGVQAAQPPATCKVLSTTTQTKAPSPNAPYQVYPNGSGIQQRTLTTERCRGRVYTIVGLWYYV